MDARTPHLDPARASGFGWPPARKPRAAEHPVGGPAVDCFFCHRQNSVNLNMHTCARARAYARETRIVRILQDEGREAQRIACQPKTLVIAEKPSVAQDIVRALTPVAGKFDKHDEYFESESTS